MSKLSFRSRQVDFTKPFPIYLSHDLPDLQDFAAINRSVPQMPTGMEKDEEAEHHLQRALSALQAFGDKSSNDYSIPTPKVEIDNKMYERIYNIECPKQKQYIRIQPFSNDYDYPDYDADYEDEKWLNENKSVLPDDFSEDLLLYFETIMDRLEKATAHSSNIMTVEEAKLLLMKEASGSGETDPFYQANNSIHTTKQLQHKAELEQFLLLIYEYWKKKRTQCKHPLTPIVLTDKSGVVTQPNNPYLVFRRRTEKMQTRKNRKNEEQSYEKMLILKRDLCRAQQILKLIKKRENFKKEFLQLTLETFEKRYKSNDYDGALTDSIVCLLKPSTSTSAASSLNANASANHSQSQTVSSLLGANGSSNNFTNNTNLINVHHNHTYYQNSAGNGGPNKLSQNNHQHLHHHHLNHNSEKNLSSIDKTIVNLINSNKLKTLGSPPHSSLKKVPQLENDFLVESIYNPSSVHADPGQKQPRRPKKDKNSLQQQHLNSCTPSSQNTISNLISLNNTNNSKHGLELASNKKLLGDLIDLSNKQGNKQGQLANNKLNKTAATGSFKPSLQSTVSPLTNRSNTTPKSSLDTTRYKAFDMDLQHHQSLNNSNKRRMNSSSGVANLNARRKSNNKADSLENDNGLVSSQTDSNNNKKNWQV